MMREAPPSVQTTLVTRTDLRDFAMGLSNLETVRTLASQGVHVSSLSGLHAKAYVFDNHRALITSANATRSGMRSNWECGMALYEPSAVGRVVNLVISGFGADSPPTPMSAKELSSPMRPIEELRSALPTFQSVKVPDTREPIQEGSFTLVDSGTM